MMKNRYSLEQRQEAVELSNKIGVILAAKQLGIKKDTIYGWRSTRSKVRNPKLDLVKIEDLSSLESLSVKLFNEATIFVAQCQDVINGIKALSALEKAIKTNRELNEKISLLKFQYETTHRALVAEVERH